MSTTNDSACGSWEHVARRTVLRAGAIGGLSWFTPIAERLARAENERPQSKPRSVIMLWMQGGPSQIETFDPKPGKSIAGGSKAIKTAAPDIQIADLYPH